MPSPRQSLVAALTAALDPDVYRVVGSPDVPDTIETGTVAVRVYATTYAPGPLTDSLTVDLTAWVLTPHTRPGDTDDALDDALMDVLGALHDLDWTTPATANREVMADTWNGWRLTLQAFAQMEGTTP